MTPTLLQDPSVLHGSGRYEFTARIDGDDLVVEGVRATWFGGAHDPQDDGETASGLSTRSHPDLLGCALPMDGFRATAGSPLPRLPWLTTKVVVTRPSTTHRVTVELVDLGPAAPPLAHAAIDLTVAAFRALGGNLRTGVLTVDYRILGGALYLPTHVLLAARAAAASAAPAPLPRAAQAQGHPDPSAMTVLTPSATVSTATGAASSPLSSASTDAPERPDTDAVPDAAKPSGPGSDLASLTPRKTQDPAPRGAATGRVGPAVPPVRV